MKVERLHVIVHPGFIAETDDQALLRGKRVSGSAEIMRRRYVEGLQAAGKNELALAFLHTSPEHVAALPETTEYGRLITDLQAVMKGRLLLHSNGRLDLPGVTEDFGDALAQARALGFEIDEDTPTVAYGETLQCCVSKFANNANIAGRFRNATVVEVRRCDTFIPCGANAEELAEELPRLRAEYPRLQYAE